KLNACFVRLPDLRSAPEVLAVKDIDWRGCEAPSPINNAFSETMYGPFATRQHVKACLESIAGEHGLCWRQLGWEKRGGPCFARQVRKCRGACLGEETPEQHNLRLATALAPRKLATWPWPGRVAVREGAMAGGRREVHVFDHWVHVGTARDDEELAALVETRTQIEFDPDVYRIVQAFLKKRPGGAVPLPAPRRDLPEAFETAD